VVNRRPGWRRHLPALLYLLALAALILALARPQATVLAPKEQATVMLVMDVSGSMNAIDIGFGSYEERAMGQRKGRGAGLGW
jgi:Ca-activated chloride channel family protein